MADDSSSFPFRLRLRATNATFTYLPRIKQIVPNAAVACHKRLRIIDATDETLLKQVCDWRPLPGNVLDLPTDPFGDAPIAKLPQKVPEQILDWKRCTRHEQPHSRSFKLTLTEKTGQHEWTEVDDLQHSGPGDRHFVVDRQANRLLFGDGLTGRIPISSGSHECAIIHFKLEYEVGGGARGNLGPSLRWTTDDEQLQATNVVPAVGGEDLETLDSAIRRASTGIRRRDRAVTREDIESLAISTPGASIKRSHAVVGYLPQHSCTPIPGAVTVFVVPDLPQSLRRSFNQQGPEDLIALRPDAAALAAVARFLECRRMLTHEIHVAAPDYVEAALHVEIAGIPFDQQEARSAVVRSLSEYLHPLYGGPNGAGWPFGGPIRPSELVRQAQRVIDDSLHVQRVSVALLDGGEVPQSGCGNLSGCAMERPGANLRFQSCTDVPIRPHALVALRAITVAFIEPFANRLEGAF